MNASHLFYLQLQWLNKTLGKESDAVFVPFTAAHHDVMLIKINILHT